MTDFTVIASPKAAHQVTHQEALARGLEAHGLVVARMQPGQRVMTHRVACWGWRVGRILHQQGHDVLVMERGYIGDRFAWTSLAWNGLNGLGKVPKPPADKGERFDKFHPSALKPLSPDGDYALICGQVPGDASLRGMNLHAWYCAQAQKRWGVPALFRPHPLAHKRGHVLSVPNAPFLRGELEPALANAKVVISFNSNTGVDAILAGKTTYVEDRGGMAYGVEDRTTWAHNLAWRQWSIDEIQSGYALQFVGLTGG